MKDADPPIRFHDFCKPRDYREMAGLIARQLPLWAEQAGVSEWEMTWRFQQIVRRACCAGCPHFARSEGVRHCGAPAARDRERAGLIQSTLNACLTPHPT
jgi:hypothetical protein